MLPTVRVKINTLPAAAVTKNKVYEPSEKRRNEAILR